MTTINIALADDDQLILQLLNDFLNEQPQFEVVFTESSGHRFLLQLQDSPQNVDIAIVDLKMADGNGLELTETIHRTFPSLKVIILSSHYRKSYLGVLLKIGAAAFLPKGISPDLLTKIIATVHQQGYYLLDEQLDILRQQISSKSPTPKFLENDDISQRELEVLRLICQQKTSKEIGEQLFISSRTVDGHKNNLFAKTGAKNMAGLVIYAIQNQLISPEELPII